ncbi:MAG: Smr/MutS family protein [Rickettsiales bacterium]|jgi:DNA-nicking Smr family endonuclease|nr:Smr/MutS family protein [Rickettsiales bacterium]
MEWEEFKKTCNQLKNKNRTSDIVVKRSFLMNEKKLSFDYIPNNNDCERLNDFVLEKDKTFGIDKNLDKKLRDGNIEFDDEIDLHGMSLEEAYRIFINFINNAIHNRYRYLLIITGKGLNSKTDDTIKNNLPKWLKNPYFNDKIIKYMDANVKHGGTGAVYVLLKKRIII